MIGQVCAAEEFPAGMAANCLGVVRRFGGEGLGDFQRGHRSDPGNMSAEEHVFQLYGWAG